MLRVVSYLYKWESRTEETPVNTPNDSTTLPNNNNKHIHLSDRFNLQPRHHTKVELTAELQGWIALEDLTV